MYNLYYYLMSCKSLFNGAATTIDKTKATMALLPLCGRKIKF